jgi:DNA modification methylase
MNCKHFLQNDNSQYDLCITSPPYNMRVRLSKGKYAKRTDENHISKKYRNFADCYSQNDFYDFHKNILTLLLQKCDLIFYNISIVTGSKRQFFKLIGEFSDSIKDVLIWYRSHAAPAVCDGVLNRKHEQILIFDRNNAISRQFKQCNFKRGTMDDVWRFKREYSSDKNHSATFPVELSNKIIANFAEPGMKIIDPFMGTGTVGISALKYDCLFTGIELDEQTFKHAQKRLSTKEIQKPLFWRIR